MYKDSHWPEQIAKWENPNCHHLNTKCVWSVHHGWDLQNVLLTTTTLNRWNIFRMRWHWAGWKRFQNLFASGLKKPDTQLCLFLAVAQTRVCRINHSLQENKPFSHNLWNFQRSKAVCGKKPWYVANCLQGKMQQRSVICRKTEKNKTV